MPHFTWDVSFGQVIVSIPIFWVIYMLVKLYSMMLMFRMEHETLMMDWSKRNNIDLHTLPTRQKKWW